MVYSFTSEYAATMHLELRNDRGGVILSARNECAGGPLSIGAPTDLGCIVGFTPGSTTLDIPVLPGRSYTVFVDSTIIFDKPDAGPFQLDVTMVDPKCGNGILETGEEWDDGNTTSGDGVTSDCKLESPTVSDKCVADPTTMAAIDVSAVGDGTYKGVQSGTTTGMTNGDFKTCPVGVSGPQAPDVVWRMRSPIDGLATVTINGKFQPAISAYKTCVDSAASMIACDNSGLQKISFPVTKDADAFVVVDSYSTSKNGPYTLNVAITPPVCGNGIIEGGESCDDSNATSGDGCSSTCQLEPVTAHEKCLDAELVDMGTADSTGAYKKSIASGITNLAADQSIAPCASAGKDAVFKVVAPIDGLITARVTAPFDASIGIREGTCTDTGAPKRCSETGPSAIEQVRIPAVKDGVYYIVVDSVTAKDSGWFNLDVSVSPSVCGDGAIGGSEGCDDGNTTSGDGCSATCTIETLAGVDTCPGYTVPFVADGAARIALVTVDTSKLSADYAGSCGGAAKDAVLSFSSPIAGKAVVEVLENDRVILHTRTTCTNAGTQTGCATKSLTFPVAAGKPFSVFVDGPPGVEGPATVRVTVTP
jgi:cysteine-rich repeat protein